MGDGSVYNSFSFEHEYEYGGNYTVKLTVTDPWRADATSEQTVEIDGAPAPYRESVVFQHGTDGYGAFRIPTIIKSGNGDLLAFSEGRINGTADYGDIDVVMRRSTDNGKTWGELAMLADHGDKPAQNMSAVYDEFYEHRDEFGNVLTDENGSPKTGQVVLVWNNATGDEHAVASGTAERKALVKTSLDHGLTWSVQKDITAQVRVTRDNQKMHIPPTGHAIQLTTQAAKDAGVHGRLFFAGQWSPESENGGAGNHNYAFWSDDHGVTWEQGGLIEGQKLNEVQAVELANGFIMFNSRNYRGSASSRRAVTISEDFGTSFGPTFDDDELITPTVASTIIRYTREDTHDKNRLLFANPAHDASRRNMTVRMSYDEGQNWVISKQITKGAAAYSDLVIQENMDIGLLWEDNSSQIRYSSFTLDWLTDGLDSIKK